MSELQTLQPTGLIKDDRQKINDNFEAVASDFAGETFPTSNVLIGMTCYRTDQKKLYRYTSTNVWDMERDLNATYVTTDSKATTAEMEAGTDDNKYATSAGVKASIEKNAPKPAIMTGATSTTVGASGLVPVPAIGEQAYFLAGSGAWLKTRHQVGEVINRDPDMPDYGLS